jgi:hypothetical protein
MQIAQQITQEKSSTGKDVSGSVVTKAVQTATGANSNNINQVIRQAAQTLANAAGVPVEKVEAVIIQIALQISQAQGKAISGQSIFQIATQIAQNPNGVLAQAILKLVREDDGGKSTKTTTVIKNVVKSSSSSRGSGGDGKDDDDDDDDGPPDGSICVGFCPGPILPGPPGPPMDTEPDTVPDTDTDDGDTDTDLATDTDTDTDDGDAIDDGDGDTDLDTGDTDAGGDGDGGDGGGE